MRCRSARFIWPVLLSGLLYGGVNTPKIGLVRYSTGTIHPVYGVPGSFVVGPAITQGAKAVSFSDSSGLIAAGGFIRLVEANGAMLDQFNSTEPSPVLSVSGNPETAIAWLPSSQSILYWNGTKLIEVSVSGFVPGQVVSLQHRSPAEAELYCLQPDNSSLRVRLTIPSGTIESIETIPGSSGRVWNIDAVTLFANATGLHSSDKTGVTEDFKLPDDLRVESMSSSSLHLSSTKAHQDWVLRVENSRAELWLLPAEPTAVEGMRK